MGAVGYAFRAEFRTRWRSWLAVAVLITVIGGFVLAATAAGRRTDNAFPDFVASHGFDVVVYTLAPQPHIASLPGVASAKRAIGPENGQPTCDCTHPIDPNDFGIIALTPGEHPPFTLVSGRLPNPSDPDEVLASYTMQQNEGVHLGTVIHVPLYAPSQAAAYNDASGVPPRPTGPNVALRVVGFEATESEFPSGGQPSYDLYVTSAFARTVVPRTLFSYIYLVRLRHGAADAPRFDAAVSALGGGGSNGYENEDGQAASVEAAIHPQAIGWWILAALAALVGLAVIGQALARQSLVESEAYPTMAALGAGPRLLFLLGMARNVVVGVTGAVGAMVLAFVLSPMAPVGEARLAETSTGFSFDAVVLLVGAIATLAVTVALGTGPAVRSARARRADDRPVLSRPSRVVAFLTGAGARPSVLIGVRNALQRRSGGPPVPVGSALLGTALAVVALCGTAVFGASLSHLTATPRLYGDTFQLNINDVNGGGPDAAILHSLEDDRVVTGITQGITPPAIDINHIAVGAIAGLPIRGGLLLATVSGHVPRAIGQIGLGSTTMRQVGAHLGSVVQVTFALPSGAKRRVPFRVVSQISFPVVGNGTVSLGSGAAMTIAAYQAAVCPAGAHGNACRSAVLDTVDGGLLVQVASGPRGEAEINHVLSANPGLVALTTTPTSLINFGEAVNFPLIFGGLLAIFGAATLAHLLVVSVSRRRREMGLLRMLGFVRGQLVSTVGWQATTVALIGIIIGAPIGVVIGRMVWLLFAGHLGVVPVAVVPFRLLAVIVAGVIVVANLLAVVPALTAARARPALLLRAP